MDVFVEKKCRKYTSRIVQHIDIHLNYLIFLFVLYVQMYVLIMMNIKYVKIVIKHLLVIH
jgi:hypothetical protein